MKTPLNGIGPTTAPSPRDVLLSRAMREARQFASAAREIKRLQKRERRALVAEFDAQLAGTR